MGARPLTSLTVSQNNAPNLYQPPLSTRYVPTTLCGNRVQQLYTTCTFQVLSQLICSLLLAHFRLSYEKQEEGQ